MNKVVVGCVVGLGLLGMTAAAQADGSGLGVGVKAGTLGLGAEITKSFTPSINGRLGFNNYTFSTSGTESDIKYDIDLKWQSTALLLDWHPFEGSFRLTAGYIANGNKIDMDAKPAAEYKVGDVSYDATDLANLNGTVKFDSGPYVGFGWGNAGDGKGLGFSLEVGAVYQGSPNVSLRGSCTDVVACADFDNQLAQEEKNAEDSMSEYKWYPQVALGISYAF